WFAFPLVSALRSTSSAADCSALFTGFTATMAESDFPRPCIIGSGSSPSPAIAQLGAMMPDAFARDAHAVRFASRCSVQREIQKFIDCAQNCAWIVKCLRLKQSFADKRVYFRFA